MTPAIPKASHGYGQVAWLPPEYLNADETRALGELDLRLVDHMCGPLCALCRRFAGVLDPAHIVRKGIGGKPKGTTGPTVRLCRKCHRELDDAGQARTLAIRRDGRVCLLVMPLVVASPPVPDVSVGPMVVKLDVWVESMRGVL